MTISVKQEVTLRKMEVASSQIYGQAELQNGVARTIQVLRDKHATLGFAESCTGGLLASTMTQVSGVSDVFMGALVTYATYTKADILGVDEQTLAHYGPVSTECAKQMSEKALMLLKVDYAVAVTGLAGPSGGTTEKPVGLVFISVSGIKSAQDSKDSETNDISTVVFQHEFGAKTAREDIQRAAVIEAHKNLQQFITENI